MAGLQLVADHESITARHWPAGPVQVKAVVHPAIQTVHARVHAAAHAAVGAGQPPS